MAVPIANPLLNATALASVGSLAAAFVNQANQELARLNPTTPTRTFRDLEKLIGCIHESDPHIGGRLGRLFNLYFENLPGTAKRQIISWVEVTLLDLTEPLLAESRRRAGIETGEIPAASKIAGGLDTFPDDEAPRGRPTTGNRSWALGAKEIKLFTEALRTYQEWERLPYEAHVSGTDRYRVIRFKALYSVLQTGRVAYSYWPEVCKTLLRYFHRQSRNPDATPHRLRQAMKLFLAMEASLFAREGWVGPPCSDARGWLLSAARRAVLLAYGTRPFEGALSISRWLKGEDVYNKAHLPQEHYRQVGDLLLEGGMDPDETDRLIVESAREELEDYSNRGMPQGVCSMDFEWVILTFGGASAGVIELVNSETPFTRTVESELRFQMRRALITLTWRQERVLRNRFGIDTKEMTLEQFGNVWGVTAEYVRQVESLGLERLRRPARAKRLEPFFPLPDNDWPAAVRRY